jgi:hypothetical protein
MFNQINIHIPIKSLDLKSLNWLESQNFYSNPVYLWIKDDPLCLLSSLRISKLRYIKIHISINDVPFVDTLKNIYSFDSKLHSIIIGLGDILNFEVINSLASTNGILVFDYKSYDINKNKYYFSSNPGLFEIGKLDLCDVFSFIGNVLFDNTAGKLIAEELSLTTIPQGHQHSFAILNLVLSQRIKYLRVHRFITTTTTYFEDTFHEGSSVLRLLINYHYISLIKNFYPELFIRFNISQFTELKCLAHDFINGSLVLNKKNWPDNLILPKSILYWLHKR